jgi:transcriptional regulator with XRE-family HTH domain
MYGERIKKLRKELEMSQGLLSQKTGFAQTSISVWEKSSYPPIDFIEKALKILKPKMSLSEFFYETEEEAKRFNLPKICVEMAHEINLLPDDLQEKIYNDFSNYLDTVLLALKKNNY